MNMAMAFEQQARESAKAFAAFKTYLDMGPERSLSAVGAKLGKSKVMMEKWSRKFDWHARVAAHGAQYPSTFTHQPSTPSINHQQSTINQLITRRELAALLKVSTRTIDRMVADGHIPTVRLGKLVRFHWPAVQERLQITNPYALNPQPPVPRLR